MFIGLYVSAHTCLPAAGLNGCGMEDSEGKHKPEQAQGVRSRESAVLTYLRIVNTGVGQH